MPRENLNKLTDDQLVELLHAGNLMAFNEIYSRYWKKLYAYAHNILCDDTLVEDGLQEVFTNVWVKRSESEIENLKAYLFQSVKNNAITKLRKARFTSFQEQIIENLSSTLRADVHLVNEDLHNAIDLAVNSLPERRRKIFCMSRFEHLSIKEIAEKLNISHRTVENQLSLAMKQIKVSLNDELHLILVTALILSADELKADFLNIIPLLSN